MTLLIEIALIAAYAFVVWSIVVGSRKSREQEDFDAWVQRREERTRRR